MGKKEDEYYGSLKRMLIIVFSLILSGIMWFIVGAIGEMFYR